jgi:hypothetical protein
MSQISIERVETHEDKSKTFIFRVTENNKVTFPEVRFYISDKAINFLFNHMDLVSTEASYEVCRRALVTAASMF